MSTFIPHGWEISRLDRVATVNARIGWKALTASEYQSSGYAFLATPNIKHREIDFVNVNYISDFRFNESPELALQKGDVLLAKDGNTLGVTNIVRYLPQPATVNGSIAVLRPYAVEPRFLHYFIASNMTQQRISAVRDGMGVPHLFQRDIKRFPTLLPPYQDQHRIADFLDAATKRIECLKEYRSRQLTLLHSRTRHVASEAAERLIQKYGLIRLSHLLISVEQGWSPQCENRPATDDEWGVIKAGCVNGGRFDPTEHKALPRHIKPRAEYQLRTGDLLMSRASGSPALIGSTGVARQPGKLLLCDKVYRLHLDHTRAYSYYVAHMLRTHAVRKHIESGISGAEGMANNLPTSTVRSCMIPNAPLAEQMATAEEIARSQAITDDAKAAVERSLTLLTERRTALITAAVTGEFDVSTASGRGVTDGLEV